MVHPELERDAGFHIIAWFAACDAGNKAENAVLRPS